jgi:hypothetical protein
MWNLFNDSKAIDRQWFAGGGKTNADLINPARDIVFIL